MESLRKALGPAADQLLRLLLRHLPRPGLRDPAPQPRAPVRLGRHGRPAAGLLQEPTRTRTGAFQKTFDIYFRWLAKYHERLRRGRHLRRRSGGRYLDTHRQAGPQGRRRGPRRRTSCTDVFPSAGLLRLRLGGHRRRRTRRTCNDGDASGLIGAVPGRQPGDAGRRQRLRDVPRHPVHRRAVAAEPDASSTRDNWRLRPGHYDYITWANAWFNGPCAYWKYPAVKAGQRRGLEGEGADPDDRGDASTRPRRSRAAW